MSATTSETEHGRHDDDARDADGTAEPVVVRRRAALLLVLGGLSSSLAIVFLWRATGSGSWVDAVVCAVLGAMAAGYLTALVDARAPLLVADELGVRVRVGREWRGLPWSSVERLWLLPREGMVRDARLVVVPQDLGHTVEGLERSSVRSMQLTQRLHGAPLAVPLGMTTRVTASRGLAEDLRLLCADHDTEVRELDTDRQADAATPELPQLTDELVGRREAVVRTLPGVSAPATADVSHVALVPEQTVGLDGSDDDEVEDTGDFSVLGRIFGRPDDDTWRVPTETETATETGSSRDVPAPSVEDVVDAPVDAPVDEPVDERVEASDEQPVEAVLTEPAEDAEVRAPWWHRLRRRVAGERTEVVDEDADHTPADTDTIDTDINTTSTHTTDTTNTDTTDDGGAPARELPTRRPIADGTSGTTAAAESGITAAPPADDVVPATSAPQAPMAPAAHVAVSPLVASRSAARRVEVVHRVEDAPTEGAAALDRAADAHGVHLLPESAVLRPGQDDLLVGPASHGAAAPAGRSGVTPLARPGDAVAPLQLGGFATRPAYDPVIGPEVRAARTRLGMSVDELAERTRIRPHVIEALEVDDFVPSGGDVYARGHLRTLGRVLGKDATPWLHLFDSRYATGGTTARRVFEAELASAARPARGPRSGPHWSLVAAVVLALGLVWAAATALGDDPAEVLTPAPLVAPAAGQQADMPAAAPVRVLQLSTGATAATVTVRDADGAVALVTTLQPGETRRVRLALPLRVLVTEGGPVQLRYAGRGRGQAAAPGVVVPGAEGEAALPSVRRLR